MERESERLRERESERLRERECERESERVRGRESEEEGESFQGREKRLEQPRDARGSRLGAGSRVSSGHLARNKLCERGAGVRWTVGRGARGERLGSGFSS